jgi:hypothetical protein
MKAPQTFEIAEQTETRTRGACLFNGCSCKDARIVSHRRAAFFAAVAARSGQTAHRVIDVEPGWRIPPASLADLDLSTPNASAWFERNER